MSEEDAYAAFIAIRYAENEGAPYCVWCKCAAVYEIKTRRKFKCKACHRQFSVTSQTMFASRKLEYRDILYAIAIFTNGAKGISALQLSRDMSVQYKTAFVLAHKIRESLSTLQAAQRLSGEVEIDGAYFGGYVTAVTALLALRLLSSFVERMLLPMMAATNTTPDMIPIVFPLITTRYLPC